MTRIIPAAYRRELSKLPPLPRMITEAISRYGILEGAGAKDNPILLAWAKELGLSEIYSHDSIPWCGLFMASVALHAGYKPVEKPLWALSWRNFGNPVDKPQLGDILIKTRKTATGAVAGHVCLVLGEDATHYHVIGGNQSDSVSIARIPKKGQMWFRRPPYKKQPLSVRTINFPADAATAGGSEA